MTNTETLTFLYTDIEGSTRRWEQQPDAMRSALERHDALLRGAIERHNGRVFRTVGDAFCSCFKAAPDAVAAAVEIQRSLRSADWEVEDPIWVRIAIHTGEASAQAGDYVGGSLNHIGRLLAACYGGQIVLTLVTEQLVRNQLPADAYLVDLGMHRFRDLIHPEHIFQVGFAGVEKTFPPLKSLEVIPNNFPTLLTSFVGRTSEMETLEDLMKTARLLTLTGPGGTGKTRLALEVANRIAATFPDGAWLVELAPLVNPALLSQSVAMALNVREIPGRTVDDVLLESLRPKSMLLVLDNCEHMVEACARFASAMLQHCPGLKIITSSREMLGLSGEVVFRVPSLSLPAEDGQASGEEALQSEAVRLFVDRAAAIRPNFILSPQNMRAIVQICARLDGIPLAIELAAARVGVLSPDQIAARLDDRFRLLTGGSRTALPRQQTLEALFDWSYELLLEEERVFFRRMSVFSGGWTLAAAEAVGSLDALDLLTQLVNKSLVVVDWQEPETRYHMLETTRQYAQKKLVEAGEAIETRRKHMDFYARLSDQVWEELKANGLEWLSHKDLQIRNEQDNVRAALEWALDHDILAALRIASGASYNWANTGGAGEMRMYLRRAIQAAGPYQEYTDGEDPFRLLKFANALATEVLLSLTLGENNVALQSSERAVELARRTGDLFLLCEVLSFQSEAAGLTGDAQLAYKAGEECIAIARQSNQPVILAVTLLNTINFSLLPLGDYERALYYADEISVLLEDSTDAWSKTTLGLTRARIALQTGDIDAADRYYQASFRGFQDLTNPYFVNVTRSGMADVARYQKRYQQAEVTYAETARHWQQLGNFGAIARCLECVAFMAIERFTDVQAGEGSDLLVKAGKFLGAAGALRQKHDSKMTPAEQVEYNQWLAQIKEVVSKDGSVQELWEQALQEGRRLSLEEAIRQ